MLRTKKPSNISAKRSLFIRGGSAHHLELGRAYLALGEKQKARDEFKLGLSLPSAEKDDDNNKQRARATLNKSSDRK